MSPVVQVGGLLALQVGEDGVHVEQLEKELTDRTEARKWWRRLFLHLDTSHAIIVAKRPILDNVS